MHLEADLSKHRQRLDPRRSKESKDVLTNSFPPDARDAEGLGDVPGLDDRLGHLYRCSAARAA